MATSSAASSVNRTGATVSAASFGLRKSEAAFLERLGVTTLARFSRTSYVESASSTRRALMRPGMSKGGRMFGVLGVGFRLGVGATYVLLRLVRLVTVIMLLAFVAAIAFVFSMPRVIGG